VATLEAELRTLRPHHDHSKLQHQINHADAATVTELRNDLATLQRANGATVTELRDDLTTLQRQMKASARAAAVTELRDDLTTLQRQITASTKAAPVSAQMPELSGKSVGSSITTASRPSGADSKSTVSKCEADGGLYDCANSACRLQRRCATNSGLEHCACAMVDGWSHTLNPTCAGRIKALEQEESDLGHFALAKTVAGFQILVHKTDDIVSTSLLSHGFWENDHLKATFEHHEALGRGPYEKTYLDVGANLGYFSLMAASHGFKVSAFEAMTLNAKMINVSLCANPSLDKLVTLHNIGLSDSTKTCYIVSGWNNRADGMVNCGIDPETYKPDQANPYYIRGSIQLGTINDLLDQDYFMMKMDIEGHEPFALSEQGSSVYFNKHSIEYMVTESHQSAKRGQYLKQLSKLGYALRPVDYSSPGRRMVEQGALIDVDDSNTYDIKGLIDVFCEKPEGTR